VRVRRILVRVFSLALTLAAFGYVLSLVSLQALGQAFSRVPLHSFAGVIALTFVALLLGAQRWRWLFFAFGAPSPPSYALTFRYYLVGFFYNTYLPGGVGGDLVRAVVSRAAFGVDQRAASLATVLVERVLGLAGLLALTSIVLLVHPLPLPLGAAAWLPGLLGLSLAGSAIASLWLARFFAERAPPPLSRWLRMLPAPREPAPLWAAALASLATQVLVAISGHLLISALEPSVAWLDSLVIIPVASAAAYLPFTIAGAGVREAVFLQLYAAVGVAAPSALAASLLLWGGQACVAACGGVVALLSPSAPSEPP
jgi:glycosyltransferase 2 family protein